MVNGAMWTTVITKFYRAVPNRPTEQQILPKAKYKTKALRLIFHVERLLK